VLAEHGAGLAGPPLELVFTWGEEIGHLAAKALDICHLRARQAYVLDGLTRLARSSSPRRRTTPSPFA
jgi:hypothetical protein